MAPIRIACLGDIMCGESFYAMGKGVRSQIARHGIAFVPESTRKVLRKHDVVVGNVECVLSDINRNDRSLRSMQLRGTPYSAALLHSWGVTVANVANNHILEHGVEAARDTVKNLQAVGISVVGAGTSNDFSGGLSVSKLHINGCSLSVAGISLRDERYSYNDVSLYELQLFAERCANADEPCICTLHWGDEYIDRPGQDQVDMAHSLLSAGATAVIGHHPHVVQGIEFQAGQLLAYSLGNFIFNGTWKDTRWSVILSFTLENREVTEVQLYPIVMDESYRPKLATGSVERMILREIVRRNKLLRTATNSPDYLEKYKADLIQNTLDFKKHLRKQIIKNMPRLSPFYWPGIISRPIRRRIGAW